LLFDPIWDPQPAQTKAMSKERKKEGNERFDHVLGHTHTNKLELSRRRRGRRTNSDSKGRKS